MFIKSINSAEVGLKGTVKRTLSYGKYKGFSIAIDNYLDRDDKIIRKRFVVWNEIIQLILHKEKDRDGKFKRVIYG